MYGFKDYVRGGLVFSKNRLLNNRKQLTSIMIYATDQCNSTCKHCYIWAKKDKKNLSFQAIKDIIDSPAVNSYTTIGLEGGEFILHPEAEEILAYISRVHKNFTLLSNGVYSARLIDFAIKYKPVRLYISLDGPRETYKKMRGVDAFNNVVHAIRVLKNHLPISAMYTITQYNNFKDLECVTNLCKFNQIDLRIGIYSKMEYFETWKNKEDINDFDYDVSEIPDIVNLFPENYDFLALYSLFKQGKLHLGCNSISENIVIYPNGDIPVCQNKCHIIGNIYKESLYDIINKKSTIELHKELRHQCNDCWINFHRKYDIVLYRNFEKILPKYLIYKLLGKYQWTDNKKIKFKEALKQLN